MHPTGHVMPVTGWPLVLVAMPIELGAVRHHSDGPPARVHRAPAAWRLEIAGAPLHVVVSGQGPAKARAAAAWAVGALRPSVLIVAGLAGGVRPEQHPGDIAVIERAAAVEGTALGRTIVEGAARMASVLSDALQAAGITPWRGLAAAVRNVADPALKRRVGLGGAVVADMETLAAFGVAAAAGIPVVGLRAIVDPVEQAVPRSLLALGGLQGGRWFPAALGIWRMPVELPAIWSFRRDLDAALASLGRALTVSLAALAVRPGGDP